MLFSIAACKKKSLERLDEDVSLANVLVKSKLVVGVDISHPPLSFIGSNGMVTGFDIDILTAVAKNMDIDIFFRPIKWTEKLSLLNRGEIDCLAGGFSLDKSQKNLYEATKPYFRNAYMLMVLKESNYYEIEDLRGKQIGGERDSAGINTISRNNKLREMFPIIKRYPGVMHGVLELKKGEIEGVVADATSISKILTDHPGEFRVFEKGLVLDFYGYAFKKGNKSLKNEIEKNLLDLEKKGTLLEISVDWFGSDVLIIGK